ncbi:MAG TPA: SDR family oxidoreductase [Myxococcota bacterium]|jgi:short-subunit dehydrogenase|nr:SDR family oxidoreductase [Myxococcota bacterium]
MKPPLHGVVVLTGASSGIGAAMAEELGEARVLVLVARRVDRLESLAARLPNAEARPCDLRDLEACEALIAGIEADHGGVDVLINNAGLGDIELFERTPVDKVMLLIDVNVRALTWLTHRVLPGMLERGRGGILNVSSGYGMTWTPLASIYGGSKHYVSAFTEALRSELYGTGVVVTQTCPGPVVTEFWEVAGNPTGFDVPSWVQIPAAQCARESLRGFRRGRAMVVTGWLQWLVTTLGRVSPWWVLRLVYWPIGGWVRRRARQSSAQ